jgi:hypothetical protein
MGAGIAATNADELKRRLHRVRDVLDGWLADLDAGEATADRVRRRLTVVRDRLREGEPS